MAGQRRGKTWGHQATQAAGGFDLLQCLVVPGRPLNEDNYSLLVSTEQTKGNSSASGSHKINRVVPISSFYYLTIFFKDTSIMSMRVGCGLDSCAVATRFGVPKDRKKGSLKERRKNDARMLWECRRHLEQKINAAWQNFEA